MSKIVLSKETAEKELERFKETWGVSDDKAIISGGAESSFPDEIKEVILAAFMTGTLVLTDDGKKLEQGIKQIGDHTQIVYGRSISAHVLREAASAEDEVTQALIIAEACSDVPAKTLNDLSAKEFKVVMAVGSIISFA